MYHYHSDTATLAQAIRRHRDQVDPAERRPEDEELYRTLAEDVPAPLPPRYEWWERFYFEDEG